MRVAADGENSGGTMRGTMEINEKAGFPQSAGVTEEYNLFGLRNAAVIQNPLIQ